MTVIRQKGETVKKLTVFAMLFAAATLLPAFDRMVVLEEAYQED
jgi:hypothetical protein